MSLQVVPGSLVGLPQHRHPSPLHDQHSHFCDSTRTLQADRFGPAGPGSGDDTPDWEGLQHVRGDGPLAPGHGHSSRAVSSQRGYEEPPVGLGVLPGGSREERERGPGQDGATPIS